MQLTKQVALDYARDRIHVNALCPGCKSIMLSIVSLSLTPAVLKTNMTRNLQNDPELYEKTMAAHPFGGMGEVEDVARAAVFLASEDASWVTGVPLPKGSVRNS